MLSNNLKIIGTKILKPSSFLKSSSLTMTSVCPAARHFSVALFGGAQNNALVHIQTPIKNAFSAYTPTAPVLAPSNARFLSTIAAPVNDQQEAQVKEQRQEFSALSPDLTNKLRAEFEVRRAARDQRFLIKTFE